jgi:hypothetical protein
MTASQFAYIVCETSLRNYIKFDIVIEHHGRQVNLPALYSGGVPFTSRSGDPLKNRLNPFS